jgi:hypothetical protein
MIIETSHFHWNLHQVRNSNIFGITLKANSIKIEIL